jgi:hypothetical protein
VAGYALKFGIIALTAGVFRGLRMAGLHNVKRLLFVKSGQSNAPYEKEFRPTTQANIYSCTNFKILTSSKLICALAQAQYVHEKGCIHL